MTSTPLHHSLDYVELVVSDLDVSKRFFADAFGWHFNDYGPGYAGIVSPRGDGNEAGGLLLADEVRPAGGTLVLLYSDDLDATKDAIVAAGGKILQEPYEFPGGRRLHFSDPSGTGGKILQEPYEFPGGRRLHFSDPSGTELGVWSAH